MPSLRCRIMIHGFYSCGKSRDFFNAAKAHLSQAHQTKPNMRMGILCISRIIKRALKTPQSDSVCRTGYAVNRQTVKIVGGTVYALFRANAGKSLNAIQGVGMAMMGMNFGVEGVYRKWYEPQKGWEWRVIGNRTNRHFPTRQLGKRRPSGSGGQ